MINLEDYLVIMLFFVNDPDFGEINEQMYGEIYFGGINYQRIA